VTGASVKVILRFPTIGAKAGDTLEVDPDTAKRLVANGHAYQPPATKKTKE
jgi:hypothetical protein